MMVTISVETSKAVSISQIVRDYSKHYSDCLKGTLSETTVKNMEAIINVLSGVSIAEMSETIEHVKKIVSDELPKYARVNFS